MIYSLITILLFFIGLLFWQEFQNRARVRELKEGFDKERQIFHAERTAWADERRGLMDRWLEKKGSIGLSQELYPEDEPAEEYRELSPKEELEQVNSRLEQIKAGGTLPGQSAAPIATARLLTQRKRALERQLGAA